MNTGINLPLEVVAPVVLGLVSAIGWLVRRYERLTEVLISAKTEKREAAILLREALRERDPDLEPLRAESPSDIFEVEHRKDGVRVRSLRPPPPEEDDRAVALSPRQARRLERFARTGDPSTPPDPIEPWVPRKKTPSRSDR